MAGGMRRGAEQSISARVDATRAIGPVLAPPATQMPPIKHCWVTGERGRTPGLLLTWEQRADGWFGRVVHPVHEQDGWVVVDEWLPAAALAAA